MAHLSFEERKRMYNLHRKQDEIFLQAEPMFDFIRLHEAYDYYMLKGGTRTAQGFFDYLYHLEKDIPLDQQRCYPR